MIKGRGARADGSTVIVLGLSDRNLAKLKEGLPIHIFGAELGIDDEIVIFWGPTEQDMANELHKAYGRWPDKEPSKQ